MALNLPAWIWFVGAAVAVVGAAWGVHSNADSIVTYFGGGPGSIGSGSRPRIWWCLDDSQTNTREWMDWGDRETTEPNEPYLRLCARRARELWSHEFDIVPLTGRAAVVERVRAAGGAVPSDWGEVPPALWMAWSRAALLSVGGGLWLDGSVLPMGNGGTLWRRLVGGPAASVFGTDAAESRASGAAAAGASAGWAASRGHPVWTGLEKDIRALIGAGAPSWSSAEARRSLRTLWDRHCSGGSIGVDRAAEISRDRYGRRLELDTLLGATEWSAGSTKDGLWVPMPDGRDALERSVPYQWFLRMSEKQLTESNFVWAKWATRV